MRILWLSPTPAGATRALGLSGAAGGGWIGALERALGERDDLELWTAFPWRVRSVERLGTVERAFALPRRPLGGRLRRAVHDLSCRLEPDRSVDDLMEVVEACRPDIVHAWGSESHFGLVGERTQVPVLVELQGLATPYSEAYLSAFSHLDLLIHGSPRRLATGRGLLQRYWRYRRRAARERRILVAARYVSGRTAWDRQLATALAPNARYFHCDRVLRAAFYTESWRPRADRGGARATLHLASTLRGNAYKGLDVVHRAAAILGNLGFEVDWSILGVRRGEELERVVEGALGGRLAERGVHLVGRVPADELIRRLLASDLYVHPSWIDNSPNALAEAAILGLPIVSTQVGGIPSLLDGGKEGVLVPQGDPWALAGAVAELARDPESARRMGAAARGTALRRHDPERIAGSLVGIYRQIVSHRE